MPAYDAVRFSPPAPIASVELRSPVSGQTLTVPMLLDTGADVTLLPRFALDQLAIPTTSSDTVELMGFDGNRSSALTVNLDLIFLGLTFRGRFPVIDQLDGILGRNILNHLQVAFDGPKLSWDKIT